MGMDTAALLLGLLVTGTALVLFIWQAVRYFRRDADGAPPRDPSAPYDPRDDFGGR